MPSYRAVAVLIVLALACLCPPRPALAGPAARDQAATYTFAFQDADVSQVADAILGQSLGVAFTVDPSVTAKLTFSIDRRLNKEQLLKAFEQVLAAQDIVLVRQGESLLITTRSKARGSAAVETSAGALHHAGYQTIAVPVTYATPSEVAKALQAISPNANIVVFVDDNSGLLILGGTGDELEAALSMVHLVDRDSLKGAKLKWFPLTRATASVVAGELDKILKAAGAGGVTVVPLTRLNGLFVFARTSEQLDQVADWVGKLDTASDESATTLWTYHPRSLSADSLAQTLNEVLLGQMPAAPAGAAPPKGGVLTQPMSLGTPAAAPPAQPPPVPESQPHALQSSSPLDDEPVRIGVEKETNILLIQCSASRWLQIQKILDQVDQTPGQVLIEASILEVTLNDDTKFGVDWSILGDAGRLAIASLPGSTSVAAQLPGFAATFLSKNIQVAVNTLGTHNHVEVVSAPKIIVLDNHMARLDVGDQVPVVVQSAQNTTAPGSPVLNSVDYQSTGVIMNVTPRITGDNRIFLDIAEQVSSAINTETSGIDSPTIQQREFDSSLVLADGGTVALGGLISTTKTRSNSGIPLLKDARWIGPLFRSKDDRTQRDELIVLITATIIKDQPGADKALARLLGDMHDIKASGLLTP